MDENGTIVVTPLEQIKFWKLRGAPGEWASLFYLKFPLDDRRGGRYFVRRKGEKGEIFKKFEEGANLNNIRAIN
jgi:hypothetical protein